jgi:hypothetical protein
MQGEPMVNQDYTAAFSIEKGHAEPRLFVVPGAIALITVFAWLWNFIDGPSVWLAQAFGIGLLLVPAIYLSVVLFRHAWEIGRPVNVFFLGCIYFFVLDSAFLREVRDFAPAILLGADTLIAIFLVVTIATHALFRWRSRSLISLLERSGGNLSGNAYFWITVSIFLLAYLERFWFADFNLSRLWHGLLLSRSDDSMRNGVAGDWRVFLQPIEVFFMAIPALADLGVRRGASQAAKLILFVLVLAQLGTMVLSGGRGDLLIAVLLPLFIRAAQHDRSTGRWLLALMFSSFLLAPVMDLMNQTRGGWYALAETKSPSWNILEAHRDDNFYWLTNLVAYRSQDPGLTTYGGYAGFIEGIRPIGAQWLEMPIPRVLWPDKPEFWKVHDETRNANDTDSVVADLFRAGGISCVVSGAILFGLWLCWLEPVYAIPKTDGEAIVYAYLAVSTVSLTRSASPFNTEPLLLSCLLFIIAWRFGRRFIALHRERVPRSLPERAFIN